MFGASGRDGGASSCNRRTLRTARPLQTSWAYATKCRVPTKSRGWAESRNVRVAPRIQTLREPEGESSFTPTRGASVTCREATNFIMDYLSGELPEETKRSFEEHLSVCPNCRRYLARYKATIALGRRAFDDEKQTAIDAGIPEELVAAILTAKGTFRLV